MQDVIDNEYDHELKDFRMSISIIPTANVYVNIIQWRRKLCKATSSIAITFLQGRRSRGSAGAVAPFFQM